MSTLTAETFEQIRSKSEHANNQIAVIRFLGAVPPKQRREVVSYINRRNAEKIKFSEGAQRQLFDLLTGNPVPASVRSKLMTKFAKVECHMQPHGVELIATEEKAVGRTKPLARRKPQATIRDRRKQS